MGQYFPSSFLHLSSINGQSSMVSCESDLGRPCSGKSVSFGQLTRFRSSNEKAILLREMTQDLDNHISKSFEDGGDYANRQRWTRRYLRAGGRFPFRVKKARYQQPTTSRCFSVAGNSFSEEKDVRDVHPLLLLQMSCSPIKVLKFQQSLTISCFRLGGSWILAIYVKEPHNLILRL
ncbi:hypothetical protein CUMW_263810 [Citrus unshiu]|uniref:Uncharacterized protein n=1 Tax=Citrus unshiu TaxID=55188 RepID=A0A2H5QUU2_CITUN|nr:hypothetical protein CUMW_263810 [Citrus unshiu]